MTSKLVVNTIEADTGISSVSFGSSISLSSTSKFFFGAAGIDIGADTNINRPASGVLGFNINSNEKVRITSDGVLKLTGQSSSFETAGLTHHTNNNLYIRGGTSGAILQSVDSNEAWIVQNDYISGSTGGIERLRIKLDGKVGVGTDSPLSVLTAYGENRGEGTVTGQITAKDNAAYNASPTAGLVFQGHYHSNGAQAIFAGITGFKENATNGNLAGALGFHVRANGAVAYEAARITSGGYLKLGSTDGGAWHTIRLNTTTNNAIKDVLNIHSSVDSATAAAGFGVRLNFFGEQLNGNEYIYGSIAGLLNSTGSNYGDLAFYTNNNGTNTERLRITSVGKVGINTSSPTNVFTIHHNDNNQFAIKSGDTNADIVLADSGGSSRLRHSNSQFEVWTGGVAGSYYAQNSARRLAVTSSGYLQKLNNPSFRAGLSSNTVFTTNSYIVFNDTSATWHHNTGNHYNTSNGRFTAPVSGVYQFNACVIFGPFGGTNNVFMGDAFLFYVNGGNAGYSGRRGYYISGDSGNNYYTDHMSVNLFLNATDYVQIRNGAPYNNIHGNTYYTWFAGTFLG